MRLIPELPHVSVPINTDLKRAYHPQRRYRFPRLVVAENPPGQVSHGMFAVVVAPVCHYKSGCWCRSNLICSIPPLRLFPNVRLDSLEVEPFVVTVIFASGVEAVRILALLLLLALPVLQPSS